MRYQEVIIIGAPRSGTNVLRDVLCELPGCGTWPCDEINAVWRHGNARWPSDALPAEMATRKVRRYLNRRFARRARAGSLSHVIEKTCANSLRVPFVARALPRASYLFIFRQPLDAVSSAMQRWRGQLDLSYTLKKARFVPPTDLPYYGWRFARNRFSQLRSAEQRLPVWGPRIEGLERLRESRSLVDLCALQWNSCVELAAEAFTAMPSAPLLTLRYEDFVTAPVGELRRIRDFLKITADTAALDRAVRTVTRSSVGKGRRSLEEPIRARVLALTASGRSAAAALLASPEDRSPPGEEGPATPDSVAPSGSVQGLY